MNWSRNYSQFLDIRKRVQPPFALRVTVLERVHSTVHNMLAMYSNLSFDNWAELLPFVQLAHNTAYSTTLQETPHFLMFGRAAVRLSITSSEFRPPPHRKLSSTIPNKLSKTCN